MLINITLYMCTFRDLPMDYTFCGGPESYASQPSPSPPPQFDMLSENKKAKDSGKTLTLWYGDALADGLTFFLPLSLSLSLSFSLSLSPSLPPSPLSLFSPSISLTHSLTYTAAQNFTMVALCENENENVHVTVSIWQ